MDATNLLVDAAARPPQRAVRALVTGAGGFLGRRLVQDLAERGHDVTAMLRPSSARAARSWRRPGPDPARGPAPPAALAGELDGLRRHPPPGVGGGATWRAVFTDNVTTTENLLAAIGDAGWRGRLVHVSSFAVYALNQQRPGALIDESTPLEPEPGRRDDYAWSKLLQERLCSRERAAPRWRSSGRARSTGRSGRFQYRLGRPLGDGAVLLLGGGNRMPLTYVDNTASLWRSVASIPAADGRPSTAWTPIP